MITKPTVLILGAGASSHLGYPLGAGLIADICKGISTGSYFSKYPSYFEGYDHNYIQGRFWKSLSRSGYPSIETFLEHNAQFIELGKLLIALCLKEHENEDRLFAPHNPGWYSYLLESLLDPTDEYKYIRCPRNDPGWETHLRQATMQNAVTAPLTIITFNYDRSLEVFLHQSFEHRFIIGPNVADSLLSAIKIIHPHGILGKYPDIPYRGIKDGDNIADIAQNIRIIHELPKVKEGFCNTEFKLANEALCKAKRFYFLGFGFHQNNNMRRFKFFSGESAKGKEILSTNVLDIMELRSLRQRLDMYGLGQIHTPHLTECNTFFKRSGILD